LEKRFEDEPLPVEIFGAASDQLGQILLELQPLFQRQRAICLLNFQQRLAHDSSMR
jgi:hypothetical protein